MNKKSLLYLFFAMAICCVAKPVGAFESWNGEITKNINLRKLPGLNGEIITGLKKGDKVVVSGKHGDWYKIVLERGIYGFKGWAFGEYIKKGDKVEKKEEPFTKKREIKTRIDGLLKARPLEPEIGKNQPENKEATNKTLSGLQMPLDKDSNKKESLNEKTTEIKEASLPKERLEDKKKAPATDLKKPEKMKSSDKTFSHNNYEHKRSQPRAANEFFKKPHNVRTFMGLLTRLLPVLMSCLALIFSYKAFNVVKRLEK